MDSAQMLRAQRAQRASWLELDDPPRRALQVRRPNVELVDDWREAFAKQSGLKSLPKLREIASAVVIGWRGFTEADLLGAAVGASSEQPFASDNFAEWVTDEVEVLAKVTDFAINDFNRHEEQKAAAEKN